MPGNGPRKFRAGSFSGWSYGAKSLPLFARLRASPTASSRVFDEGCAKCHEPPAYTNNKLTPVIGFTVPDDHRDRFDVMSRSVGTDPELALRTRRGTGYYKVPSLKGVWNRGMFGHSGWAATLEDWFDPNRLNSDYVPTGWKGPPGTTTRAVEGHEFGLDLSEDERDALIAFLRTL